jgi:hypothetical protein
MGVVFYQAGNRRRLLALADDQPLLWIATSATLASCSSSCATAAMRAVDSSSPRPRGRRRGDLCDTSIRFSVEEEEGGGEWWAQIRWTREGEAREAEAAAGQAPGRGRRRSGVRCLLRRVREDSRAPDSWLNMRDPTYPDRTVDVASSPYRTTSGLAGYMDPLPARERPSFRTVEMMQIIMTDTV